MAIASAPPSLDAHPAAARRGPKRARRPLLRLDTRSVWRPLPVTDAARSARDDDPGLLGYTTAAAGRSVCTLPLVRRRPAKLP